MGKIYVEIQGGHVTPLAPSLGRPCLRRQDVLSINVAPCDLCRSLIRILVPYSNVHVKQARTFHKITYIGLSVGGVSLCNLDTACYLDTLDISR